jgi:hypothetical protein
MERSTLATIAAGLGTGAVAGYGLSMGRGAYRESANLRGIVLVLVIILLYFATAFFGVKNMIRGYDKSDAAGFFKVLGYALLALAVWPIAYYLCSNFFVEHVGGRAVGPFNTTVFTWLTVILVVLQAVGLWMGLIERQQREQEFYVATRNDRFLTDAGITETGGEDITHYDGDGNPLRFIEAHPNQLVFMVVGRRGKRAFIQLADNGEMIGYTGVTP